MIRILYAEIFELFIWVCYNHRIRPVFVHAGEKTMERTGKRTILERGCVVNDLR